MKYQEGICHDLKCSLKNVKIGLDIGSTLALDWININFFDIKLWENMVITLDQAPFNETLKLVRIENLSLVSRFHHIGLYEGDFLKRLDEDVLIRPVKINGPAGPRLLGAGMATKVVVHLADGRKLPVFELKPGESGHIEGMVGGSAMAESLAILGLKNDDEITCLRSVPPMEYSVLVDFGKRIRIGEGIAAKIWGIMQDRELQFSSAAKGEDFKVKKILGGKRSRKTVFMSGGIEPGSTLKLEGVKPAEVFNMHSKIDPVVILTNGGLRLILEKTNCHTILVEKASPDA